MDNPSSGESNQGPGTADIITLRLFFDPNCQLIIAVTYCDSGNERRDSLRVLPLIVF
jgi:hypothetical protein